VKSGDRWDIAQLSKQVLNIAWQRGKGATGDDREAWGIDHGDSQTNSGELLLSTGNSSNLLVGKGEHIFTESFETL